MQCPVCQKVELKMSERQGIEIDYCPKCRGVWLDRGELDKIIERSAGDYTPSRPTTTQQRYDDDRDDEYYEKQKRNPDAPPYPRKRKSFLDEIFDIFD
jgi:uncharacterized protein